MKIDLSQIAEDAIAVQNIAELIQQGLVDVVVPDPTPAQLRSTIEYLASNLVEQTKTVRSLVEHYGARS